jgi:GT2 family glycosyltransferase
VKSKVPNVQQAKEVEEVDWISGAFLMVKREGVEKAGFMDEDFFLYAEEVEWCSRLRKAGLLCLFGNLNMVHLEGTTINKSQNLEEKGYYNLYDKKGLQLMVSNHVRGTQAVRYRLVSFFTTQLQLGCFTIFRGRNPP